MTNTPEWLEAIKQRREVARDMVGGLASGRYRWTMCIPANPSRDSDLVLASSLDDIPALLQLVEKQREALELIATLTRSPRPETVGILESRIVSPMAAYRLGKANAAFIAKEALLFKPEGLEA